MHAVLGSVPCTALEKDQVASSFGVLDARQRGLGVHGQYVAEMKLVFRTVARMYSHYRNYAGILQITPRRGAAGKTQSIVSDLLCDVELHTKRTCGAEAGDITFLLLHDWEKVPETFQVALGITWDRAKLIEDYASIFNHRGTKRDMADAQAQVQWGTTEAEAEALLSVPTEELEEVPQEDVDLQ
jgi:hypothetical protein